MDKNKVRYDLAMQCALASVISKRVPADFGLRDAMIEQFHYYYQAYSFMDDDCFTLQNDNP